jgi:hypothetical protein
MIQPAAFSIAMIAVSHVARKLTFCGFLQFIATNRSWSPLRTRLYLGLFQVFVHHNETTMARYQRARKRKVGKRRRARPSDTRPEAPAAACIQFPNMKNIEAAVKKHFADIRASNLQAPASDHLYKIEDEFGTKADYWKKKLQLGRFENVKKPSILYRPQVVDKLFEEMTEVFETEPLPGLMVTGPSGIGKSHSLVNLVHKLQSTGDYLVTFFPDCNWWPTATYFLEVVCDSFGIELRGPNGIGLGYVTPYVLACPEQDLETTMEAISQAVANEGKKWVFVFDHVNELSAKYPDVDRISALPYPHSMVVGVLKYGAMSIISASADLELDAFRKLSHPTEMEDGELRALFGNGALDKQAVKSAGGNPYFVKKFLSDPARFFHVVRDEVIDSISRFRAKADWSAALDTIICSVLALTRQVVGVYDKKYLVPRHECEGWLYIPTIPVVYTAFRGYLWREIMDYVEQKEQPLLDVCGLPHTTDQTRGRIFNHIVLRTIQEHGLQIDWSGAVIRVDPGPCSQFAESGSCSLRDLPSNVVFVPNSPAFPSFDFFVRSGPILVGFETHVGKPKGVSPRFFDMCRRAFGGSITEIWLIFLSPDELTKQGVCDLIPVQNITCNKRIGTVRQVAFSRLDIFHLSTIPWPNRESG